MNKIYIYDLYKDRYTHEFDNVEEVIDFLVSKTSVLYHENKFSNPFLDEINLNLNDKVFYPVDDKYYTRRYMFIDSNLKILDMRQYWDEIKERLAKKSIKSNVIFEPKYGDKLVRYAWEKEVFRYRIDPVPGISNRRYSLHYLRKPKTIQEKRMLCDEDVFLHTRANRRNLPTAYDDICRTNYKDKCWKRKKIRKQWQKNL